MKKKFKMQDLDCANCAAKMEDAIRKIDGVHEVSISFMAQRMSIDADEEKFDEIMQKAQQVVRSVEPDTSIIL
ncbi:MAG: heavy-metal-associated domain-containing protein [Anaerovoracaceae bacterium]